MNAVGTPVYMAPEAHKGTLTVAMDVYSFGVVILEALSGRPSFDKVEKMDIVSGQVILFFFPVLCPKKT